MKKFLILFAFLYGSLIQLHAQSVQVNDNNYIEINAKKSNPSDLEKNKLATRLESYDTYEFDLPELKKLVRQNPNQVNLKFNLPGTKPIDVSIYENEMRPPNYKAASMTENGLVDIPRAECHTYKGYTEAGDRVRLSITAERIYGFFEIENKMIFIQSLSGFAPNANANKAVVYASDAFLTSSELTCDEEDVAPIAPPPPSTEEKSTACFSARFGTDSDFQQFTANGSNVAATIAVALAEMNVAEGFFDNEFNLQFEIVFQNVWAVAADPYATFLTANDEVEIEIRNAWTVGALGAVVRDYVIMFTGRVGFQGGAVGSVFTIGAMCNIPAESYCFVSIPGADAVTTSHEIGHSMGGLHGDSDNCGGGNATFMCPVVGDGGFNVSGDNETTISNHIATTGCLVNGNVATTLENNLGTWTQDNTDNLNWSFSSGGTPSNNTGPSGAYQGNSYLYTEASFGNSNRTARLISAPVFICQPGCYFSFGYHMFGSSMGSLSVQVSEDNGATFNNVWTRTGNSGNVWLTAPINMNAFVGQTIIIRVTGNTGPGWSSDIAIDDLALGTTCPISPSTNFINFPQPGGSQNVWVNGGSWEAHHTLPSWVTVNSFGSGMTITAAANNSTNGRMVSVNVSCGPTISTITVVQAGIPVNNDPCGPGYASIPNNLTFESTYLNGWTQDPNDDFNWTRKSGSTSSSGTGPTSAAQGSYYMYTEATNNFNNVANLVSPCYNLANVPSPKITFQYHMWATTNSHMGVLRLQVSQNGGNTWSTIWSQTGNQGTSWKPVDISLASYTNVPIQLRFNGTTGPSYRSDMAIDDIQVKSGACFDQYESNNTFSTAYSTTIGSNVTYNNACLSAGDNDYYRYFHSATGGFNSFAVRVKGKFSSTVGDYRLSVTISGNTVTAETLPSNGSTTDTYMYLYNNNGSLIAQNDNSGQGNFSKIVTSVPNAPGVARDDEAGDLISTSTPDFELRNYPNPFNQITNFDFDLGQESTISLIITDITGKVVAMPINDVAYEAGNHIFEYDASALAAGVYNYSLRTQDGMKTKQMVIVR